MGRQRREYTRQGFKRDVQRLFVIASEGTETEIQYFEEFKSSALYVDENIFIEPLKRNGTASSPSAVLAAIKGFKKQYNLRGGDELWVLIDRDKRSWRIQEIDYVAQQCLQGGIGFAMSNPCFELWLLLHFVDITSFTQADQQAMLDNGYVNGTRTWLEAKLSQLLTDGYNKNNIRADRFLPACYEAMDRARSLDKNPGHRWPNELGTHVYRLMEKVLKPKT